MRRALSELTALPAEWRAAPVGLRFETVPLVQAHRALAKRSSAGYDARVVRARRYAIFLLADSGICRTRRCWGSSAKTAATRNDVSSDFSRKNRWSRLTGRARAYRFTEDGCR